FRLSYPEVDWIALAQRAYALWRALEHETGTTLLLLDGLIDAEADPAKRLASFEETGVPHEVLTPREVRERFGYAYDDVELLVYTRDAGITLADAAVRALAQSARVADERFVFERKGRIVVGSACSGHGFKFAPAVGEVLADLVLKQ